MRLIQNMTTIAECPAPEYAGPSRAIKIAVIGGGGVGKTGKKVEWRQPETLSVESTVDTSVSDVSSVSLLQRSW